MPLVTLNIKPGITTEATQTLAKGGWSRSQLIQFRDGYLEKRLGWAHLSTTALVGVCRSLHDWMDLAKNKYLAAGTHLRLELYSAGVVTDITPERATHNVAVSLTTTIGSPIVTVTDAAHGASTNDEVYFVVPVAIGGLVLYGAYQLTSTGVNTFTVNAGSNATASVVGGGAVPLFTTTNTSATIQVTLAAHGKSLGQAWTVDVSTTVGGVTLTGSYIIASVVNANNFTIVASGAATSSTTGSENGGNARYLYLITAGLVSTTAQTGYGSGTYGLGTWGRGTASATATRLLRIWSLDNFSTDLLALINDGKLYKWTPPISTGGRATAVGGDVPSLASAMFVSMPQLQAVLLGAEVLGVQDPLLVRWSDIATYVSWTATAVNEAGSFRLSRGSRIVGGLQGPLAGLIWTDLDMWQMQYIGLPFIYSFSMIAAKCGLIAQNAVTLIDRKVYWMSQQGFFVFDGGVRSIPCPVWDALFLNLNSDNKDKIIAASSGSQREVTWFYPSLSGTGEIDSYVKLNTITGDWDYGTLVRTAWIDQNVLGEPVGVDSAGLMQQTSNNNYDNDGQAMVGVMAETGFMDIADGDQLMYLDKIIPDFKFLGTDPGLMLTIKALDEPFGTPVEYGPYSVNASTKFISTQIRARQMALRINCDDAACWFRLGRIRVQIAPAGRVS